MYTRILKHYTFKMINNNYNNKYEYRIIFEQGANSIETESVGIKKKIYNYQVMLNEGLSQKMTPKQFDQFLFPNQNPVSNNKLKISKCIFADICLRYYRVLHSLAPKCHLSPETNSYILDIERKPLLSACKNLFRHEQATFQNKINANTLISSELAQFIKNLKKSEKLLKNYLSSANSNIEKLYSLVGLLENYLNSTETFLKIIKKQILLEMPIDS